MDFIDLLEQHRVTACEQTLASLGQTEACQKRLHVNQRTLHAGVVVAIRSYCCRWLYNILRSKLPPLPRFTGVHLQETNVVRRADLLKPADEVASFNP
jgi:hypothetical protein